MVSRDVYGYRLMRLLLQLVCLAVDSNIILAAYVNQTPLL